MTAVLHAGDVVQTRDHQLHTVVTANPGEYPQVTEWTGQHPHPLTAKYVVVHRHHPKGS